uniref:Tetratricopeptide repeat domain 16 n=1 Tax=Knipowitschia caucasica TaxID=637954 RepID=A0AAV2MPI3_KNICA
MSGTEEQPQENQPVENLELTRREQMLKRLFGSSKVFLTFGEKSSEPRPELQACAIIQSKAQEHYRRAYVLQPDDVHTDRLARVFFLQGEYLFHRELFKEALEAFRKAKIINPASSRIYDARSVACLSALGLYTDCVQLVTEWMEQDGPTADLYVLRARLHLQLSKDSLEDVKCALELNPSCPEGGALFKQLKAAAERAKQFAVDRALCGDLPQAQRLINQALENLPQDPHLYLLRALTDLVKAVELSQGSEQEDAVVKEAEAQLVLTYNDFSLECFSKGLYEEATALLNKAIEEEKNQPGLYINRGDCFFKQRIWLYALADYQQAEELLGPNDPTVSQRLSVFHKLVGSISFGERRFKDAMLSFSQALQYDPTLSQAYELRSKAHRQLGNMDQAKEDFVRTLILQPDNTELPAMLMSLFPGHSFSSVLSTAMAQCVRVQLQQAIQNYSSNTNSVTIDILPLDEENLVLCVTKRQ